MAAGLGVAGSLGADPPPAGGRSGGAGTGSPGEDGRGQPTHSFAAHLNHVLNWESHGKMESILFQQGSREEA